MRSRLSIAGCVLLTAIVVHTCTLAKGLENVREKNVNARHQHLFFGMDSLAMLAPHMNHDDVAEVAERVATALEKSDHYEPLAGRYFPELMAQMDPPEAVQFAARGAKVIALALEEEKDSPSPVLAKNLASFTARMNPTDAEPVVHRAATVVAVALKNVASNDFDHMEAFAGSLTALTAQMKRTDASRFVAASAEVLTNTLGTPEQTKIKDLKTVGRALSRLAPQMDPTDAAWAAGRLTEALENQFGGTDDRLANLGSVLAALMDRMDRRNAVPLAVRSAHILTRALKNHPRSVGIASSLAEVTEHIPSSRRTRLLAISHVLPWEPDGYEERDERRKKLAHWCESMSPQDLADMLKWPFCVGEAEQIVLEVLEEKTGGKFDGNLWKFVEQAPSLGIKNLNAPARRPRLQDVLDELAAIRRTAKPK